MESQESAFQSSGLFLETVSITYRLFHGERFERRLLCRGDLFCVSDTSVAREERALIWT
jgi:hypothetical protein